MIARGPMLREVARGFTHLVRWVEYHSRAGAEPSSRRARLTVYSSCSAGDDAALARLERLEATP